MNTEQLLKTAITKVLEQGAPSINQTALPTCMYRAENGNCCAVGHLITDEAYSEKLECNTVDTEIVLNAVASSIGRKLEDAEINYLRSLQMAHDRASEMEDFVGEFTRLIRNSVHLQSIPDCCLEVLPDVA